MSDPIDGLLGDTAALDAMLAATWSAPAGPIATALGLAGARRIVGGNDRIALDQADRVVLVLSGGLDIFLVDATGRYPFAHVAAGGLAEAAAPADPAVRLIGVPSPDSEIAETGWQTLSTLEADPAAAALLQSAREGWAAALAHWHAAPMAGQSLVSAAAAAALARRQAEAAELLARRAGDRLAARHDLAAGLGDVIDLIDVGMRPDGDDEGDLRAAADTVLKEMGLAERVLRGGSGGPTAEAVAAIAFDNGLQYRAVDLAERWWTKNSGPLIASRGPGQEPCALIWSGKHYVLHAAGPPRRVDGGLAAEVNRTAYSFYVPFPAGTLTGRDLLQFGLRGTRRDILTLCFTLLVTGIFSLVTPIALGWLMDPIVPDAERDQVAVIGGLLCLLAIGMTASFIVESLTTLRLEALADNRVQAAVWIRLLGLGAGFFRRFTAGDLANRADSINAIRKLMSQSFATFASGGVSMLFSLGLMTWYSWRVTLIVVLVSAVFGGTAYLVGRSILRLNYESLDLAGRLQGMVLQLLGSIAKLRAAGAEQQAFLQWLALYRRTVALSLRQRRSANRLLVARSAFAPFATVIVLVVLGWHSGDLFAFFRADNRHVAEIPLMSTANFVSFNLALGQFIAAVMSITRGGLFVAMIQPHYRRVQPVLSAPPEPRGQGSTLATLEGEIELRDVRFRYAPESPLALRGLSMRIPAGRFVAIVGPSGAGKSSLVRLLLGFDTPETGAVYVDKTDLRLLDPQDLRRRYGVVLQNGRLLAGSIRENVAAGLPLSDAEIFEALRLADLEDVVKALPMGLDTNMAEGATTISGGQRQRLLIARAITRRPRVLILDEATSALDNVTQRRVVENLRSLACTQIVIAQRLSTIAAADLIYVIDEGRVVESGTYLQLMESGPLFRKMAERQAL